MTRLKTISSAVLLAAMLTGCGAQGLAPSAAMQSSSQQMLLKSASVPADPAISKLISDFKGIQGYDEAAMAKRYELLIKLGDTDSDEAVALLEGEYDHLAAVPATIRPAYQDKLIEALSALDTYEEEEDEMAISAGVGASMVQAQSYADAMTRRKRHGAIRKFVDKMGDGLKKFWWGLTGHKPKRKKRRRPHPAPGGGPGGPSDPYAPPAPGGATDYGYGYR